MLKDEAGLLENKYRYVVKNMLAYALRQSSEILELLEFYGTLSPEKMTRTDLLSELSWIVYCSGFRYDIVTRYWAALREAFYQFDVEKVASLSEDLQNQAMRICSHSGFRNLRKAMWCIQNARRIIQLDRAMEYQDGLRGYLVEMSKKDPFELVELAPRIVKELKFKGIGEITVFHFLKNVGIDIFKPDIHVRRILTKLGLVERENASQFETCKAMSFLSRVSGMRLSELDTLLFVFGRATQDSISMLCDQTQELDKSTVSPVHSTIWGSRK